MKNISIVTAARRYVGVPFTHQGRSAEGLDCLGLLMRVAADCDLRDVAGNSLLSYDVQNYSARPDGDYFESVMQRALRAITFDDMQAGDILLFRIEQHPTHCAIASDYIYGGLGIIHAYAPAKRVVEHRLDEKWKKRLSGIYSASVL